MLKARAAVEETNRLEALFRQRDFPETIQVHHGGRRPRIYGF